MPLATVAALAAPTAAVPLEQVFASEVVGTGLLTLLGCGVVANVVLSKTLGHAGGWLLVNIGWGFAVLAGVYGAYRSGGHLNPAVTIGILTSGAAEYAPGVAVSAATTFTYFAGELVGGFLGAVLCYLAYKQHFDAHGLDRPQDEELDLREAAREPVAVAAEYRSAGSRSTDSRSTGPDGTGSDGTGTRSRPAHDPSRGPASEGPGGATGGPTAQPREEPAGGADKLGVFCTGPAIPNPVWNVVTEVIATFVLVVVVLLFGKTPSGLGPAAVALLVVGIGASLGGPTGYAINPARDLGPRAAHALLPIRGKGGSNWGYAWVPVVGPMIGGILAGLAAGALT